MLQTTLVRSPTIRNKVDLVTIIRYYDIVVKEWSRYLDYTGFRNTELRITTNDVRHLLNLTCEYVNILQRRQVHLQVRRGYRSTRSIKALTRLQDKLMLCTRIVRKCKTILLDITHLV